MAAIHVDCRSFPPVTISLRLQTAGRQRTADAEPPSARRRRSVRCGAFRGSCGRSRQPGCTKAGRGIARWARRHRSRAKPNCSCMQAMTHPSSQSRLENGPAPAERIQVRHLAPSRCGRQNGGKPRCFVARRGEPRLRATFSACHRSFEVRQPKLGPIHGGQDGRHFVLALRTRR